MAFICSVFCPDTVEMVGPYCDMLKIAACDANDLNLVSVVVDTELPFGINMALLDGSEYGALLDWLECSDCGPYILMTGPTAYPSKPEEVCLATFTGNEEYGFSDHTLSTVIPAAAVARGAVLVEKHIRLGKKGESGPDIGHSLTPKEFTEMVKNIREVEDAMHGKCEGSLKYKRSWHVRKDIPEGGHFKTEDLIFQRPVDGAAFHVFEDFRTYVAATGYKKGDPL
jgi:sialic acid synthase SpsE